MKALISTVLMLCALVANADVLPDLDITPGVTRPNLTAEQVCDTKWGSDARLVTSKMKKQIFANYGYSGNNDDRCIPDKNGRHCELDHLISRELGGADDVLNMWPQSYGGTWNATNKDQLENKLHKMVCETQEITLEEAQEAIRSNWILAWGKYVGKPK